MNIISHRGFWLNENEKNTMVAFERALVANFGIETDIRDYKGKLVISHDIANEGSILLNDFFNLYNNIGNKTTLALNIKSDGLASELKKILEEYNIDNYFVFDMSIPDTLHYIKQNLKVYLRHSDIEKDLFLFDKIDGFWLDEMQEEWINEESLNEIIKHQKPICIVSSELHKRKEAAQWEEVNFFYQNLNQEQRKLVSICTDFPDKFIYDK